MTLLVKPERFDAAKTLAPIVSSSSAIWRLVRFAVPSRMSAAVNCARPLCSAGSERPPLSTTSCKVKLGTRWFSSSTTRRPFFKVASCAFGSLTFSTSLLTGARPLSTTPFKPSSAGPAGGGCGPGVCARAAGAAEPRRSAAASSVRAAVAPRIVFVIVLVFISRPLLTARRLFSVHAPSAS